MRRMARWYAIPAARLLQNGGRLTWQAVAPGVRHVPPARTARHGRRAPREVRARRVPRRGAPCWSAPDDTDAPIGSSAFDRASQRLLQTGSPQGRDS
jgi:hypothetical protein